MVWFSIGRGLAMVIKAIFPTIRNPDGFVQISNGQASGLQIPFQIQTICIPASNRSFKIQTSPEFRFPLSFVPAQDITVLKMIQYFYLISRGTTFENKN